MHCDRSCSIIPRAFCACVYVTNYKHYIQASGIKSHYVSPHSYVLVMNAKGVVHACNSYYMYLPYSKAHSSLQHFSGPRKLA